MVVLHPLYRLMICCGLAAAAGLAGCSPSPGKLTVVTGKTVYGKLALEGAALEVHRWDGAGWRYFSDAQSGYHGSFRVQLPPGTYRIKAERIVAMGVVEVMVAGTSDDLKVQGPGGRIDRVVIEMIQGQDRSRGSPY